MPGLSYPFVFECANCPAALTVTRADAEGLATNPDGINAVEIVLQRRGWLRDEIKGLLFCPDCIEGASQGRSTPFPRAWPHESDLTEPVFDKRHFPARWECQACGTTDRVTHEDIQRVPSYFAASSTVEEAVEYVMTRRRDWSPSSTGGPLCPDCAGSSE